MPKILIPSAPNSNTKYALHAVTYGNNEVAISEEKPRVTKVKNLGWDKSQGEVRVKTQG